ncbi:YetF domain-containing protein [Pseudomonas sp. MGal98]|uniref:YetF domain-containing protein n=1 Tax=Pseudomonas sp. MGal98 TaxID=3162460 RepID=UPI0032EAE3C1
MTAFDWQRMLLGDVPLLFLGEVAVRALFAFVVVFVFLKVSGRRGIRQLSLFELVVILTLGSAAGDVSFYDDVPLLPVAMVFVTLLVLYRATVMTMRHSERFSDWMEGKPVTIIKDGLYELNSLDHLNISSDEFFMELRQQGVEHLGQVRLGILETDGDMSLYFFAAPDMKPGLSVLPGEHRSEYQQVPEAGTYACVRCGHTQPMSSGQQASCPRCKQRTWSPALSHERLR